MDVVDLHDPSRVSRTPDDIKVLLLGKFPQDEFTVTRVELRLYNEKTDEKLGAYSLITSFVQTDLGSIEMVYDEGFRGENSLSRSAEFLASNLGVSGLILRSVISLRHKKRNSSDSERDHF